MNIGRWVLGAVAGGLALGAVGAQAAPMPVTTAEIPASAQTVQFYYSEQPPAYYGPPRRHYGPPRERWERRPPPAAAYYPPRHGYGFYDREAAKDYVKDYRRAQKEIHKDRVRAWNRANGY
jgi:hypothetical protein